MHNLEQPLAFLKAGGCLLLLKIYVYSRFALCVHIIGSFELN